MISICYGPVSYQEKRHIGSVNFLWSVGPQCIIVTDLLYLFIISCASVLGSRLVNDLVFNQITSPSNQPTEEESMDVEEADDKEYKAADFPEIGIAKAYQRLTQNPRLSYDERNLEFAHLLGLRFEKHLWSLVYHKLNGLRVGRSFGICADKGSYLELQEERCKLHLNRAADKDSRGEVTARLLCLGELEPAVKLLLETEPTEDTFLSDQLLACLVQTSSPGPAITIVFILSGN